MRQLDWTALLTERPLTAPAMSGFLRALRNACDVMSVSHSAGTSASGGGGAHNDPLVSAGVATVRYDAGSYILDEAHGNVGSVARLAPGYARVTLTAPLIEPYYVWAGIRGAGTVTHAKAVVVDATTVDVYLAYPRPAPAVPTQVAMALEDSDFWLDVMGTRVTPPAAPGSQYLIRPDMPTLLGLIDTVSRDEVIGVGSSLQSIYDVLLRRHTATGEHNDPLISRGWAIARYDIEDEVYVIQRKTGIIDGVTLNLAGGVDVTLSSAMSGTDYFVGHAPAGGPLLTAVPASGSWGGHVTVASVTSTTEVRVQVMRIQTSGVSGPIVPSHGDLFVEVKGILA